jgi:hypothetical protein
VRRASTLALGLAIIASLLAAAARADERAGRTERPRETDAAGPPRPPVFPVRPYDLLYDARFSPSERTARVTVRIGGPEPGLVRVATFRIDPERHRDFRADGELEVTGARVTWKPPKAGGALHYTFRVDHLRDVRAYDAHFAENWALFRGDDLVPPARVDFEDGARADARLRLRLPDGWKAATPYERLPDGRYRVDNPRRSFDRPTGWILLGHLGILREKIAGSRISVAAPVGQRARKDDMLALLRWTLPSLRKVLGELPPRLLVTSAGDPFWRGGLSGPGSLYVHADRPLVTPDVTSPLLHELMHSALGIRSGQGGDWVVEGLAELYSLELLVRSKTISKKRYHKALEALAARGAAVTALDVPSATGTTTARAAAELHALDLELRQGSEDRVALDDVVRHLASERGAVTTERFRAVVDHVAGRSLGAFFRARLPLAKQPALP